MYIKDGRKVIQFLTFSFNHEQNQDRLSKNLLLRPVEEFKDF